MPIKKEDVSFTYDVNKHLKGVPENDREDAANDAGEAALEKISEYMEKRRSPVKGNNKNFAELSDKYAKIKQKRVGNKKPNLRLTGELLESLDVEADSNSFTLRVTGSENNIEKSYNHNVGDTVPKRQFLPNDANNEQLKGDVVKAIKDAIKKYKKPTKAKPTQEAPADVVAETFANLYTQFKATEREQQIARNLSLFKIEDIL